MIELLYAVIIVLGISIVFYFIFPTFQYLKIYFYPFQLLIWIILISQNQYKKHYLWDEPDFNSIHELPYPPINNINVIYDSDANITDIKVNYSNKAYSLIETKDYSKKCINNFYIPQSEICPITDIIVEYSNYNTYSDYERIEINNGYIYYKRDYQQGKFYDSIKIDLAYNNKYILIDNKYKTIKFSYSFDYQNIETIKRLEENKLLKPFKNFKNYKNITDFICLLILIFSIIYYWMGSKKDNNWNYFKIIDNSLQLILFILYLIRFILFGKVKKFFKENKDLYTNVHLEFDRMIYFINYFPKNISINSFPLALSIVIIFFFILSFVIKNKCSAFSDSSNDDKYYFFNNDEKYRIFILSFPFIIIYFICFILDIINDTKIKKIYKNTIDNWDTSPIISIDINTENDYELGHILSKEKEFYFYSWKFNYFTITKSSEYNYMNIYSYDDNNGKICGTDSLGNSLYFPQNMECPINDVFIENNDNIDYPEYKKLSLGYNNYLYYSNKKTDKSIIIDIKVGFPNVPIQLSTKKTNELCNSIYDKGFYKEIGGECRNYYNFNTIPFYNEIDHWDLYDFLQNNFELTNINYIGEISLYSLAYQGFNSTSNRKNDLIKKYKSKMNNFISLSIVKNIFSSFNLLYFIIFSRILIENSNKNIHLYISLAFIGLLFFHFIIIISCLSLNVIYVKNIMNRINNDFDRKRNSYCWILLTFFLDIAFLFYYIYITFRLFKDKINEIISCFKTKFFLCCKRNNNNINNRNEVNRNEINRNENKNISEENLCIICYQERRNIAFGCGHMCYCSNCYDKIKISNKNECPVCRKAIDNTLRIFNA